MTHAEKVYLSWLDDPRFSPETREELLAIQDNKEEIEERFYQDLKFGTAGLRGILGTGTNRMNFYTVGRAATAYAREIAAQQEGKSKGIVISYDCRNFSREFAELAAGIFVKHGVKIYFSTELRPVPILSFAIRHFGCAGGIMITASHNPAVYNGFKVYGADGGQLPPEEADAVAAVMTDITDLPAAVADALEFEEAANSELFNWMGDDIDQAYSDYLMTLSLDRGATKKSKHLPIVYTPLHGSGNKPVRRQLEKLGFSNVSIVPEQELPDGNFPTVELPNPELPEAMQMAINLARSIEASLVLATDPDADRTGVVVRQRDGEYKILTGNEIGLLLMDYILGAKAAAGTLPKNAFCVTTVVSSRLTRTIAEHYGVDLHMTFTGFKYIAEVIAEYADTGLAEFQFGFEESFGYLAGDKVRDKDAVVACMLLAEMTAAAAVEGQTLSDRLDSLYERYGNQAEATVSIYREGKAGQEKISAAMDALRRDKAKGIPGAAVREVLDYDSGTGLDLQSKTKTKAPLKGSNVLMYELEGPSGMDWMCVRPSGTEPKIKVYYGIYDEDKDVSEQRLADVEQKTLAYINSLLD